MRRLIVTALMLLVVAGWATSAQAVTIRDIIELTRAGLGDEVLLALIEVDGRVFTIDTDTLTRLKKAGVSEKVIVALVRSGRTIPQDVPTAPVSATESELGSSTGRSSMPDVVYVQQPPTTIVHEVAVPVPVYVTVPVAVGHGHGRRASVSATSEVQPSVTAPPSLQGRQRLLTDRPEAPEPEYWGWGGKLRPDAWKPPNAKQ
jgi:hypothetical protein